MTNPVVYSAQTQRRFLAAVAQLESERTPATYLQVAIDLPDLGLAALQGRLCALRREGLLTSYRGSAAKGYRLTDAGRAFLGESA